MSTAIFGKTLGSSNYYAVIINDTFPAVKWSKRETLTYH
jgi:hypothetical protein